MANYHRDQKGFGLVQMLVTSGVAILLFSGLANLSMSQNKIQRKMAMKFELQDFRNTLAAAMTNPATCKQIMTTFTSPIAPGVVLNFSSLSFMSNSSFWDASTKKPMGSVSGLNITSIRFVVDDIMAEAPSHRMGHLEINPDSGSLDFPLAPLVLKQIVMVDASNRIVDCVSTSIPSCPAGQLYSGMGPAGTPQCVSLSCPLGKVLSSILPTGAAHCVDETEITLKSWNCPTGKAARSISSNGIPDCVTINTVVAQAPAPSSPSTASSSVLASNDNTKKTCTGGLFKEPSANKSNICEWTVPDKPAGTALARITGTNGGWVEGTCSATGNGVWDFTYHCPNAGGAESCAGGGTTRTSPDGSNSCYFQWADTRVGTTFTKASDTGGGALNATCNAGTGWSFSYTCPNKTGLKSCDGGAIPDYPSASKGTPCLFAWVPTNAGESISISASKGTGSATARCDSNGQWQDLKVTCK